MVGFPGAWMVNVTGMVSELLGMPPTERGSVPLYGPAARSLAVTATVSVAGVAVTRGEILGGHRNRERCRRGGGGGGDGEPFAVRRGGGHTRLKDHVIAGDGDFEGLAGRVRSSGDGGKRQRRWSGLEWDIGIRDHHQRDRDGQGRQSARA